MVAMKRKRAGQGYDDDEKLRHQATKALTKEAKRVKTFLLQQAIRRSKAAAEKEKTGKNDESAEPPSDKEGEEEGGQKDQRREQKGGGGEEEEEEEEEDDCGTRTIRDSEAIGKEGKGDRGGPDAEKANPPTAAAVHGEEVLLIKSLQPLSVVKICLRRLGLAHTGVQGEAEVEVEGGAELQRLVGKVVEHKRVAVVMEELQERVTMRRREKLAESEGRSLPGQGRGATGKQGKGNKKTPAKIHERQGGARKSGVARAAAAAATTAGSAFVSLSGESPSDDHDAGPSSTSRNYYNKDIANAHANPALVGRRPNGQPSSSSSAAAAAANNTKNSEKGSGSGGGKARSSTEPGWAGADRAAGWGRGGGRSKNGGRGGRVGGGRQPDRSRRNEGRGGGGVRGGRGAGVREGGGAGRGGGGGAGRGGSGGAGRGGSGGSSGSGDREDSRGGTAGGEALHGSWVAKRALKDKEASATKAFSGKRITFGDDDD
ncbi:unnamed protein product [Ectocarpus sp. CCAP 1310/34]|nr:unnamed protein product [Ectocarpus sp. CCAP 1310/34]